MRRTATDLERRRSRKATAIVVALTIAGTGISAVTWAISGGSGGVSASLSDGAVTRSADTQVTAEVALDISQTKAALLASGYGVNLEVRSGKNCAANSYGAVHSFFVAHSCKWLARAYLEIKRESDPVVLVAVSWVEMPNAALAKRYKQLVGEPGTGNVTELSRQIGPYRQVRYTGLLYVSGRDGAAVWNAEVQPTGNVPLAVARNILRTAAVGAASR